MPQQRQAALVALYGDKPQPLHDLISGCQQILQDRLGDGFRAYEPEQVHATIVGLERAADRPLLHNLNFHKHRGITRSMDLSGYRDFLTERLREPITVQLSGFQNRDYPFTSRGQTPFQRSFSMQGDKAVVMGWPMDGRSYPRTLNELRVAAQDFGILHEYHRAPGDFDNDFYFRIGLLDARDLEPAGRAEIETVIRQRLAGMEPVTVQLSTATLSFVSFVDNTLPVSTSVAMNLMEVPPATDFARLYE